MPLAIAELLAWTLTAYAAVGAVFAPAFAWRGAGRVDPTAASGSLGFRLLILPGAAALWPLLLRRWLRGGPPPTERTPHRAAAAVVAAAAEDRS